MLLQDLFFHIPFHIQQKDLGPPLHFPFPTICHRRWIFVFSVSFYFFINSASVGTTCSDFTQPVGRQTLPFFCSYLFFLSSSDFCLRSACRIWDFSQCSTIAQIKNPMPGLREEILIASDSLQAPPMGLFSSLICSSHIQAVIIVLKQSFVFSVF